MLSVARSLRGLPHAGVFAPGEAEEIAAWLLAQKHESRVVSRALDPEIHREESLATWKHLLKEIV